MGTETYVKRNEPLWKRRENLAEESEKADSILLKFSIQKGQIVSHPLSILSIQHIVMKYQYSQ